MKTSTPLAVTMMNEQRGVAEGRAGFAQSAASGVHGPINTHIKPDPSAGGILSLAEEPEVKSAYIRMMVAIPEDRLFLVI